MDLKNITGQMRKIVKFEKNVPYQIDGGPGWVDQYTEFLSTRGYLYKRSLPGRGLDNGEINISRQSYLLVRFQNTLFNDLYNSAIPDLKVIVDNRMFTINSFEIVDEIDKFILFELNEKH